MKSDSDFSSWFVLGCCGLAFAGLFCGCRKPKPTFEELVANLPPEKRRELDPMVSTPMLSDGIDFPKMVTPDEVELREKQEVLGVVVAGQARAYPLFSMRGTRDHVVNDHVIDESGRRKPFTVTYCDLTECTRVFEAEDDRDDASLRVGIMGLRDGGLALTWKQKGYKQTEDLEGLRDYPHERTTWADWKAAHPDTLVYAGAIKEERWQLFPAPSSVNEPAKPVE
jgi:hypothetical protein